MIAVAKRALLPALVLGMLSFPNAALAANNDFWTEPRQIDLDINDVRVNTGATETLCGGAAPEPLTPNDVGYCRNGQYATSAPQPGDGSIDMAQTVWYRVVGNGRPVTIDLRGSGIDTVVAVYRATGAQPSASTFVSCADDIPLGAGGANADSKLAFQESQNGAGYLIQVGAADCTTCPPTEGTIDFIAFQAPANDETGPRRRCCPRVGPCPRARPGRRPRRRTHALTARASRIRVRSGSATPHPATGSRPSTRTAPSALHSSPCIATRPGWGAMTTAPQAWPGRRD